MANKFDFLQANLNETIYHIPDGVKISISANKINEYGDGKKRVENLVLYNPATGGDLTAEFRETLDKIISVIPDHTKNAEQLNFKSFNRPDFQSLQKTFGFHNLVCFGVTPRAIGIHADLDYYQIVRIGNVSFLFSEAVEKLDKPKKSRLWGSLKVLYGLN